MDISEVEQSGWRLEFKRANGTYWWAWGSWPTNEELAMAIAGELIKNNASMEVIEIGIERRPK